MILNKESNFISVVIYLYNNAQGLEVFLKRLYEQIDTYFSKYEIICVNDDSSDNSAQIVKDFAKNIKHGTVNLINMSFHQGCEASMNAGVDSSIGDFIFEFDYANEDIPVEKLYEVYQHSLKGYDIVSAAPKKTAKWTHKIFYYIFNSFSYLHYQIKSEAFRIISRRAINRCQSLSKYIPYRKAIYADSGLKADTLYYDEIKSLKNHEDQGKMLNTAVDSLILFTSAANKLIALLMCMFIVMCFVVFAYILYIYFTGQPVLGWTTTMLFLSFGFFSIFLILGMMMKYQTVLINLVFKNKAYVIQSIDKLTK